MIIRRVIVIAGFNLKAKTKLKLTCDLILD